MALQGPTGEMAGVQPGMRPRRVVRTQRRFCWATRAVFQRGRGRRTASSVASDRKQSTRSLSSRSRWDTSQERGRNMLREVKRSVPFSQTSARVASPSKQSRARSPGARAGPGKVQRYHQSSPSRSGVLSRSRPRLSATVPGTTAGRQGRTAAMRGPGGGIGSGRAGGQFPAQVQRIGAVPVHPRPRMGFSPRLGRGFHHRPPPNRWPRSSMAPSHHSAMASSGARSKAFRRAMERASWNWKALVVCEIWSKAAWAGAR